MIVRTMAEGDSVNINGMTLHLDKLSEQRFHVTRDTGTVAEQPPADKWVMLDGVSRFKVRRYGTTKVRVVIDAPHVCAARQLASLST